MAHKNTFLNQINECFLSYYLKFKSSMKSCVFSFFRNLIKVFYGLRLMNGFSLYICFVKIVRRLFEFYIQSSIHVALAICALAGVTILTVDVVVDMWAFIFLFTASVTGYNFAKFAGRAGFHHRSLTRQLKSIQVFSGFCFLLLIYSCFFQSLHFLMFTGLLGVITFFYSLPWKDQAGLRDFTGLKILIIALVWAGATLWLPLIDKIPFSVEWVVKSFLYIFFVLALILPFEIRDLKYDYPELGTIPQKIGVKNTKKLGYLIIIIFEALAVLDFSSTLLQKIITLFIGALVGVLIYNTKRENSVYYTAFWVESVPILWFILVYIFK